MSDEEPDTPVEAGLDVLDTDAEGLSTSIVPMVPGAIGGRLKVENNVPL